MKPRLALVAGALLAICLPAPALAAADTQPPTQPANVRDGCLWDFPGTAFCWDRSTDDVAVTGYDVYRQLADGSWLKVGSVVGNYTFFSEGGLVTGQYYTYTVAAKDAAGNISPRSLPARILARQGLPTPSPSPTPTAGACEVGYNSSAWPTGMGVWMSLKNTGTVAVSGWTLAFDFPDAGQRWVSGHSATWSQSGRRVTARNLSFNGTINPGATVTIGFNGAHTGANPSPTAFTINGLTCTIKP
ncbi:cellulose binding domain-containing protein [Herbidospora sp. RD11066]